MTLRLLTESDCTFTLKFEPEVYEPDFDEPDDNVAINERRARGDVRAWCCLTLVCAWNGFTAEDNLGGVSLGEEDDAERFARAHGMHTEALARLNQAIADTHAKIALLEPLRGGRR